MAEAKKKLYKVGTLNKGKFTSSMKTGTGFTTKAKGVKAQKFFQTFTKKKVVLRLRDK